MQDYVEEAIELVKDEGGAVNNRKLKDLVEEVTGLETSNGNWHVLDGPIKDEPMEDGHVFIPYGRLWYYDPPLPILVGWIKATLQRHDREVIRCCNAISLPRYRKRKLEKAQADEVLKHLETLREAIEEAIENIHEAQALRIHKKTTKQLNKKDD